MQLFNLLKSQLIFFYSYFISLKEALTYPFQLFQPHIFMLSFLFLFLRLNFLLELLNILREPFIHI